ncbi:xylanase deacetylase [Paenibacillus swuensis]|uniref:Xylanase deacetylase n=2 Tax=Paenibacillus swuensis TaxID=1178515 RepID=A0A172TJS5_9BACL|nr:xylanase deacetylase [Paenibacillus swuensis]
MENLLLWAFYIFTFYAFLPGLISRTFGFRVFQKGNKSRQIALTFDDGPDVKYTPQLLDLLSQYGVKATFFVVGTHAEKYPELVKRMHDEGHCIGIHNYVHRSNMLMRPGTVQRQIELTSDAIERTTGQKPMFYRPPWGVVNLFDFSAKRLQIILWSSMFGDWRKSVGVEKLTKRMMKRMRGGEVFLLHDCGQTFGADEEAPGTMLIALERFLKSAAESGFDCVRVDEMDGFKRKQPITLPLYKRLLIGLWLSWEKVFHVLARLDTLETEEPIFHIRKRNYSGKPVMLRDGEEIREGDAYVELHFDNQRLKEFSLASRSSLHLAIRFVRAVEQALPLMASRLAADPEYQGAKALLGISMIHRGSEHLGFDVKDMPPGLFAKATKVYLRILLSVLHPQGTKRVQQDRAPDKKKASRAGETLMPKMIWMSTGVLMDKYSVANPRNKVQAEAVHSGAHRVNLSVAPTVADSLEKTTAL